MLGEEKKGKANEDFFSKKHNFFLFRSTFNSNTKFRRMQPQNNRQKGVEGMSTAKDEA